MNTSTLFEPGKLPRKYFEAFETILNPWLGKVRLINLSNSPKDIVVWIRVSGCGFRCLTLRNRHADPDWIRPEWKSPTGIICERCQSEIQTLLKNHRIDRDFFTGRPFIFCQCIRLGPSRLPLHLFGFFTNHWETALEALRFLEQIAIYLSQTNERRCR